MEESTLAVGVPQAQRAAGQAGKSLLELRQQLGKDMQPCTTQPASSANGKTSLSEKVMRVQERGHHF